MSKGLYAVEKAGQPWKMPPSCQQPQAGRLRGHFPPPSVNSHSGPRPVSKAASDMAAKPRAGSAIPAQFRIEARGKSH